jgi:hypothetical protein
MNRDTKRLLSTLLSLAGTLILASACTTQEGGVPTLGFIGDYADLSPGRGDQASLVFIDPEADFSAYSAILVEPVAARAWPSSASAESSQDLAKAFDRALRRELAVEFDLAEMSGTGVLRLLSALASHGDQLVLELEVQDAPTRRRLIAVVDQRSVTSSEAKSNAESQVNRWATLARDRLATFRDFDAAAHARDAASTR